MDVRGTSAAKVMITGAAGFIGGFLAKYCSEAGCMVLGLGRSEATDPWSSGSFKRCDVRDYDRLLHLVSSFRPDRIFHMAAQSDLAISLEHPLETIETNVGGTVNLFESVRAAGVSPAIVVACSSAEYGAVESKDLPVKEDHALQPLHPYGVSKVAQDLLAAQYFYNYSISSVRIRIFNTTGPGKTGDLCADLTKRAIEIEMGLRPPVLLVGNMTQRALVDVRDLVRGLWLSAEFCEPGEVYNLGGNTIYSVQEVIDCIQRRLKTSFSVEQKRELQRGCDEKVIAGDTSKFRARTGWTPQIELEETIQDMLNWWRGALSSTREVTSTTQNAKS